MIGSQTTLFKNYKVIFCGISKNCINSIEHNLKFLENFSKLKKFDLSVIIVDSDSDDGTKEVINSYQNSIDEFYKFDLDGLESKYKNRIERIAISRNKCLEIARDLINDKKVIYIPLDLDMKIFKYVDIQKMESLIENSIKKDTINGTFPFSKPYYYDIFALRAKNWINYNAQFIARRYKKFFKLGSFVVNYFLIFRKQIGYKKFIKKKNIVVYSAFGGIGIYNLKNNIVDFKYEISKKYPEDISEHIFFNSKFKDLKIDPTWIVEAPKEHLEYKNLTLINKLFYFFKSFYFDLSNVFKFDNRNSILKDLIILSKLIFLKNKFNIKNKTSIIVTASDETHFKYLVKFIDKFKSYKKNNKKDRLLVFNLGMSDSQINYLKDNIYVELRDFNFKEYPDFFSWRLKEHNYKLGGFSWKPAILNELIYEEVDFLIWFDSANLFSKKLTLFKTFILLNGFVSFYSSGNIKRWTHYNALKNLNLQSENDFLNMKNLTGGILGFNLQNKKVINFLNNWHILCSDIKNIFPKNSNINDHRHDQAMLSIEYHKTFSAELIAHSKLLGISTQNWSNKILYFYDLRILNDTKYYDIYYNFLNKSTFGNSRAKILILFEQSNLDKIPLRLFFSKKIILFVLENNLNKNNYLKKILTYKIFINKKNDISLKHNVIYISENEYNPKEIISIIDSEYYSIFGEQQ